VEGVWEKNLGGGREQAGKSKTFKTYAAIKQTRGIQVE